MGEEGSMPSYLKGNYSVRRKKGASSPKVPRKEAAETPGEEFERRALEKLGGSIAFVVKSSFVWQGDHDGETGH